MKEATVQILVGAMRQARADLSELTGKLGVSEPELMEFYDAIIRDGGIASRLLQFFTRPLIPYGCELAPKTCKEIFEGLDPATFEAWLRPQAEPPSLKVKFMATLMKDAVPAVRYTLLAKAKLMPPFRHGGRDEKLKDPKVQQEIREEIKTLRNSDVKLQDLYQRLARKHGVSPTKIKRIWLKKLPEVPGN